MSFAQAPATKLVATHCCVCARPLVDAESVDSGIGPVCAERTGLMRASLSAEARAEANRIVHRLAILQCSPEAAPLLRRLREIGLVALAARIETRFADLVSVRIERREQGLALRFRKIDGPKFAALVQDLRKVPGRYFDQRAKVNTIPDVSASRSALRRVLAIHFPGALLAGPSGLARIPGAEAFERPEVEHA